MTDAYAAGLVDGEGTIYIDKHLCVRLEIQMTEKALPVLEKLMEEYGGKVRLCRPETEKWAASYRWTQFSSEATATLQALMPHLRIKRQQAVVALEVQRLKPRDKQVRWTERARTKGEALRDEITRLNRRGPTPTTDGTEPFARLVGGTWVTSQADLYSDLGYETYSDRWPNSGYMTQHGVFSTPGITEFPSDGGVCLFLQDVLVDRCHDRFFLTPKACAGILTRAGRRGRPLPAHLHGALERRASLHPSPKDQPPDPASAPQDDAKRTTPTSSPQPSPESGAREPEGPAETSARTSSPLSLFEMDESLPPTPSTGERSSAPSSADSETPAPISPMPKQDGSSPVAIEQIGRKGRHGVAYTKMHGANHSEDYETWGEATAARTLAGGERAHGSGATGAAVVEDANVRKLTPTECERLQGFPDGWTILP